MLNKHLHAENFTFLILLCDVFDPDVREDQGQWRFLQDINVLDVTKILQDRITVWF